MKRHVTESTGLSAAAVVLIGTAGHWFLTPMSHPSASHWQTARVGIQLVIGIVIGVFAARRLRVEREIEREEAHVDRMHNG